MAEIKVHYNGLVDRQAKVAENEALGYRMLHDDFDPDWQRGDEPHGTLTFTDEPAPQAEPVMDLATKVSELEARVEKLEKK